MLHGGLELITSDGRGGREHTSSLIESDDSLLSPEESHRRVDYPPRCLSFEFLSAYSLLDLHNARTRWRRITMITQLLIYAGWGVLAPLLMNATAHINFRGSIFLAGLNAVFIWSVAWGQALIENSVGNVEVLACFCGRTKEESRRRQGRVCGFSCGRIYFDFIVYENLVLSLMFCAFLSSSANKLENPGGLTEVGLLISGAFVFAQASVAYNARVRQPPSRV